MTQVTQQELKHLQDLASPFRYRVSVNVDGEVIMPGVNGQVEWYAGKGEMLVAHTEKVHILNQLKRLSWASPHQIGDSGESFLFPVERLEEMGTLLKLRRTRKSETSSHLIHFQYSPRHEGHETGAYLDNAVSEDVNLLARKENGFLGHKKPSKRLTHKLGRVSPGGPQRDDAVGCVLGGVQHRKHSDDDYSDRERQPIFRGRYVDTFHHAACFSQLSQKYSSTGSG